MAYKDISGQKFGRLTALEPVGRNKCGHVIWKCECECGNFTMVGGAELRRGNTRSCGCLHQDQLASIDRTAISHKKHGAFVKQKQVDRLYSVWKGIKNRCYQKKNDAYRYYGGRGIKVCDEWAHDYGAFRKWAMQNGYDPNAEHGKCTIDRIDNNGDYEPCNCRFVSMAVQNMNKRKRGTA